MVFTGAFFSLSSFFVFLFFSRLFFKPPPLPSSPSPLPQRSGIKGNNRSCVLSRQACQGDRGHRWVSWETVGGLGGGVTVVVVGGGGLGGAAASGRHPARQILTSSPSCPPCPPSVCPTKLHQCHEAHLVCRADRRSLVQMTQLAESQRVGGEGRRLGASVTDLQLRSTGC